MLASATLVILSAPASRTGRCRTLVRLHDENRREPM